MFGGKLVVLVVYFISQTVNKSAKSRFKYEVRSLRQREQFIRREKTAAALANSKSFWQQVHWVKKSKSSTPATSVDGISGNDYTYFTSVLFKVGSYSELSGYWINSLSDTFPTSNGVRHGGVLSLILFTL